MRGMELEEAAGRYMERRSERVLCEGVGASWRRKAGRQA